jgi:selenocysteine lyase/cysteine desulfurase
MADAVTDEAYWSGVRNNFVLNSSIHFFNNGTAGPASKQVLDRHVEIDRQIAEFPYDPFLFEKTKEVRSQIAEFVNASPEEVFFTHSTSEGMNIFAHGLDWQPGDEVILARHEHPGGYQPYETLEKRRGIKIVWIDIPIRPSSTDQVIDAYRKAITPKTRLIVISHVYYTTGLLAPVKEIAELAHEKNLLISVDGAQSLGVLPIDVQELGVDHFAGSGQKWLLAGTGTGVTYIAKSLQERVWPLYGYDEIGKPSPYPIYRYEKSGQPNTPFWLGIGAAIQLQLSIGKERIEGRVRELSKRLREGLQSVPALKNYTPDNNRLNASLTTFSLDRVAPDVLVETLAKREKIYTRTILEGEIKAIRVSTHFYNTPEEIDQLIAALKELSENPPKTAE